MSGAVLLVSGGAVMTSDPYRYLMRVNRAGELSERGRCSSMVSPYVPATEQLVVEVFVRSVDRAIDFYRALGFQLVSRKDGFATVAWEEHGSSWTSGPTTSRRRPRRPTCG